MAATGTTNDAMSDGEKYAVRLTVGAAALANCWPRNIGWPVRPRPVEWTPGVALLPYGARIWDGLRAATRETMSLHELQESCVSAYCWLLEGGITALDMEAAKKLYTSPTTADSSAQ